MEYTRQNELKDYFLIIPAAVAQKWFRTPNKTEKRSKRQQG